MNRLSSIFTFILVVVLTAGCGGGDTSGGSLGGLTSGGGSSMGGGTSSLGSAGSMMGGGSMSMGSMGSMMGPAGAMMGGGGGGGGGGAAPEAPKYRYLGDVNTTIGDHFIPLSAAYEVNNEITHPSWTRDPNQNIIVTIAGYEVDFAHDRLNPNVKPIIIKFNMGQTFTTNVEQGPMFPIIYPPNLQQGGVQVGYLEAMNLWPNAFVMGGGGGGMWIDENNQTQQFQIVFGVAVPHAD